MWVGFITGVGAPGEELDFLLLSVIEVLSLESLVSTLGKQPLLQLY